MATSQYQAAWLHLQSDMTQKMLELKDMLTIILPAGAQLTEPTVVSVKDESAVYLTISMPGEKEPNMQLRFQLEEIRDAYHACLKILTRSGYCYGGYFPARLQPDRLTVDHMALLSRVRALNVSEFAATLHTAIHREDFR